MRAKAGPRAGSRVAASLLAAALVSAGCSQSATGPLPLTVDPAQARADQATTITIRGDGFTPAIHASYDDPSHSAVSTGFTVRLIAPGASVDLLDVSYLGRQELRAVVPAGQAPGTYTLKVIDPRQRAGSLADAFTLLGSADGGASDLADAAGPDAGSADSGVDAATLDASSADTAPTPDASAPDTRAAPLDPFGTPTPLQMPNTPIDKDDPTLSGDRDELIFEQGGDLYRSTRPNTSAAWEAPKMLAALSSANDETTPFLARDGLSIIFSSNRAHAQAKGDYDLYLSTRASVGGAWSTPTPLSALNSAKRDLVGSMSADGLTIVLSSARSGGQGGEDIYIATRPNVSAGWGTPTPLAGVNSSGLDSVPWIDDSLTVIVFESNRSGGSGGRDLWVAQRANSAVAFGPPVPLPGVNSPSAESDPWLSQDLRTIVFMSDRDGQQGLFEATR